MIYGCVGKRTNGGVEAMRIFWRALGLLLILAIVAGSYVGYRLIWGTPFTLRQLADRQAIFFLMDSPELLTTVGLVDGTWLDFHSGKLSEYGAAKRDRDYERLEENLKELGAFDRSKLDRQDQITFDILTERYQTQLAYREFKWLSSGSLYPISPMWGGQVGIYNFMLTQHGIKNKLTAENYVKRLEQVPARLDAITAEAQRQANAGVILPKSILAKNLAVLADTIAPEPAKSPYVATFIERMGKAEGLDSATKDALTKRAAEVVGSQIYPAYRRMQTFLESQKAAAETQGDGVGRLPGGKAYYALALRSQTTTTLSADEIHDFGLKEVARITAEMDAILKSTGRVEGSVSARIQALSLEPDQLFEDSEEGRQQILAGYDAIIKEIALRMPQYFRTIPKTPLEVRRVPLANEKGSAGAYYNIAARDGSRPGIFFANLRDVKETPKFGMKTLAYHEGIPGHHFQVATAQGLTHLPFLRQQSFYAAYGEGWALYTELLAKEIGMYEGDPLGDLGRLQAEIFRAARLVVDTGLHAKGWTREQAMAYMTEATGMAQTDVETEIERYMTNPGQACAYKIGMQKILDLRAKAQLALGAKFDIKGFHSTLLENGGLPLTILERVVDEWIAEESKKG